MSDSKTVVTHPARPPKLTEARLQGAEFKRNIHVCIPELTVTRDTLLNPGYWGHCSKKLKNGDRIEVYPEDGSYFMEIMVQSVAANEVQVAELRYVSFTGEADAEGPKESAPEYYAKWSGPNAKFRVYKAADKSVVREGFDTKELAEEFIREHVKALAA